jgi:hypothetical protein
MFKPETSEEIMNTVKLQIVDLGGEIYQEYTIIRGFAAKIPKSSESFVQTLKQDPNIKSVERDQLG